MIMKQYVIKNIKAETVDIDGGKGIVSGYFSAFDNRDSDGDIIVKGAYDKTIEENGPGSANPRIQHLWQHDSRQPLGRPQELKEDDKGLFFRTQISKTSWGNDVIQLYTDGVINEHSVGINILQTERVDESTQRVLEVKMWEGSSVTWGANEATPTTGIKSLEDMEAKDLIKRMDLLDKTLHRGSLQDETYQLIEIEYKQIVSIVQTLLLKAQEPLPGSTPKQDKKPSVGEIGELLDNFKTKLNL